MIAFFGASVTLQKSGYAKVLQQMLNDDVEIFGYGGMHLNDAGICFIDDVLAVKPSLCFIDFFSTVYTEETDLTKEYIDTIIYKFSSIGCKLIFLFFPKKEEISGWHTFCKQFLDERRMSYIDVNTELAHIDKESFLKDVVHTNHYGSKLYADIIFEKYTQIESSIIVPSEPKTTEYISIKKLVVEKSFDHAIYLSGSAHIIGFLNTIGPYSGIVQITTDNNPSEKVSIWDEWCHYTRLHFNLAFDMENHAIITLLPDQINYIKCKSNANLSKYRKKLILHSIYYIGNNLKILNINEGNYICKVPLWYINIKGRIIQIIKNKIGGKL